MSSSTHVQEYITPFTYLQSSVFQSVSCHTSEGHRDNLEN